MSSSPISKHGVLTISGFGLKVLVRSYHLHIEDGIADERRQFSLPRICNLRRLVCIGSDGFVTLDALKFLSSIGAAFIHLDRMGKVLFVTGPSTTADGRLHRAQSLAMSNGTALTISKELIKAKIQGQYNFVHTQLNDSITTNVIAGFQKRLADADSLEKVRTLEAHAAVAYFGALRNVPVMWSKADLRKIPSHWYTVGNRTSQLTGSPRLAITPVHAILNYCFALLESEARIALVSMGLDPTVAFLHQDRANRDSLALDLMEPVRVDVERWLYHWVSTERLSRANFHETATGNVRLHSNLCSKLSETIPVWRKLLAPWAERIASLLWASISCSKTGSRLVQPATRLTQAHRRSVKGSNVPSIILPKPEHVCGNCGVKIPRDKKLCLKCAKRATRVNFRAGRRSAQEPYSLAKRVETMLAHSERIRAWKPSASDISLDTYMNVVLPALVHVSKSEIRKVLGVSEPYSIWIQNGKRIPHPRHWQALAQLTGVQQ